MESESYCCKGKFHEYQAVKYESHAYDANEIKELFGNSELAYEMIRKKCEKVFLFCHQCGKTINVVG